MAFPLVPGNFAITFAMDTGPSGVRPEKESRLTWAPGWFQFGYDPIAQFFVGLRTGRTLAEGHGLLGVFEGDQTAKCGLGAASASKVPTGATNSKSAAELKCLVRNSRLD